jgi:AmmeMemoRadiSam system protein B/AmmeMemoRadiSam system protein A
MFAHLMCCTEVPMHPIRQAAVAGSFYPGQATALLHDVQRLLHAAPAAPAEIAPGSQAPKALIVPHAGYVYSGSTAAQAYALLAPWKSTIRRVVLLGPVHRVPVRGLALPGVAAFATPLGEVAIDRADVALLAGLPQVVTSAAAHAQEHSLEVQLPFLQTVLEHFTLLPLAVGDATPAEVADVLEALWGGPETLIVISSDLSHYLSYAQSQAVDRQSVQTLLALRPVLSHQQACGATPVNGLLLAARNHHLQPRLLSLCNSGDTAGDRQRVVGYAAVAFGEAPAGAAAEGAHAIPADAGATLLPLARAAIARALGDGAQAAAPALYAPWLQTPGACFVTLTQGGQLRGCIGSLQAHRPVGADVQANAEAAALRDPRFAPLTIAELAGIEIEVSLLSAPQPMSFSSEADALGQLRPGVDGLILEYGAHRSTFLPQVWSQLPRPAAFLAQLKRKAGLPGDFWADGVRLSRYTVRQWTEAERHDKARSARTGADATAGPGAAT